MTVALPAAITSDASAARPAKSGDVGTKSEERSDEEDFSVNFSSAGFAQVLEMCQHKTTYVSQH